MTRTSLPSIAVVALASLLLGTAAGWTLAQLEAGPFVPVLATGPAEPQAARGQSELAPPSALPPSADPAGSVRVALPYPAAASAPQGAGPEPAPEPIDPDLWAELSSYLRSGRFEARMREQGWPVEQFLIQQYAEGGDPHRALALLERFPSEEADLYSIVAESLGQAGDSVAATSTFLRALELAPFDEAVLERLAELDPGSALSLLDRQAAELGLVGASMLDLQRARLLSALGRTDEARSLILGALDGGAAEDWALGLLFEVDPQAAEGELLERIPSDPSGRLAIQLAEQLAGSERGAEAIALLEGVLARTPDSAEALGTLFELDPERGLAYVDAPAAEGLGPDRLDQAAQLLLERGRDADAVELWLRAVRLDMSDWNALESLQQHAPERLWAHCREVSADTRDDELLGDVADLYWRDGRRDEAVELWRRASRLDPGDSEWTGKLRAVALGSDPL